MRSTYPVHDYRLARPALGERIPGERDMKRRAASTSIDRAGFTLVELLVVITILAVVSVMVLGVFSIKNSDRLRSAARITQSAFLGGKDRALHAKDLRGVRFTRDLTNP